MPSLPDNLRLYAVGDIHGRADLLGQLFELIAAEESKRGPAASHLIFLGDYIDRGPDAYGVIELLLNSLPAGLEADFLMGNHERMLMDAIADERELPQWLANGGTTLIEAYAAAERRRGGWAGHWREVSDMLPPKHRQFFEALILHVQYGDYFFVHAGVRPGISLDQQNPHDLLWIREPFLTHAGSFGKVIVHGHTPVEEPQDRHNRIGIDTGAVFTGRLTALVLEADRRDYLITTE